MGLFGFLFGKNSGNIQDFKNRDAVILDVRTKQEWDAGHIAGAKHIPLQEISSKIAEIKAWNKPVITYCAMGSRSSQAAKILNQHDIETLNGGGFKSLQKKI